MDAEKKTMTVEEIRKIAPKYRGKPENFDPSKVSKPNAKPAPRKQRNPSKPAPTQELPKPTKVEENAAKPTAQRNDPLWSDSIFGIDVCLREITPVEEFSPTFHRIPAITQEIYANMLSDDSQLNKKLTPEFLNYYATAMLWGRLIDIKAKRAHTQLTQTELDFRRYFTDNVFSIPQPLYLYLKGIGEVTDKRGKKLHLVDHTLPVTVSGAKGGYHTAIIDTDSHDLYEEVPALGIMGDVLMAMSTEQPAPVPNIPVLPATTVATTNLIGFPTAIGPRKEEIKMTLNAQGITGNAFRENILNTRFNIGLVQYISDIIGKSTTFRIEKVDFSALNIEGSDVQLIQTVPSTTENGENVTWRDNIVQPRTVSADAHASVGASYFTGFQDQKVTINNSNASWVCVAPAPESPWVVPPGWIANMNARRQLPNNYATAEFSSLYDSQSYRTTKIIRRMVVEKR